MTYFPPGDIQQGYEQREKNKIMEDHDTLLSLL
jgi:hypothetical protein